MPDKEANRSSPLYPAYSVFLPCEAIAILREMDKEKWGTDLKIRKRMGEIRRVGMYPNNRDLYTLKVMHSPRSSSNYTKNAVAIKRILHREAKLPWSVAVDDGVLGIWKLVFTTRQSEGTRKHIRKVVEAFQEQVTGNCEGTVGQEGNWNALMLRYSFETMWLHSNLKGDVNKAPAAYLRRWLSASEDLLRQLDDTNEIWAKVLKWRTTFDCVSFIYNAYMGFDPHVRKEALVELGWNPRCMCEKFDFFARAKTYGEFLGTAPQPFVNQMAVRSGIFKEDVGYRDLWVDFRKCVEMGLDDMVNENERAICRRYMDEVIEYLDSDDDFAHFRVWFERKIHGSGIGEWYKEKFPRKDSKERKAGIGADPEAPRKLA